MSRSLEQRRARLAKAFAHYWYDGAGPTHGEINDVFDIVGVDPDDGSKRDRVSQAVKDVSEAQLFTLCDQFVELLRDRELPRSEPEELQRLREGLASYGFNLSDDFALSSNHRPDLERLPDLPALRDHIDRIQRAQRDDDAAQLLGSIKELLESTAKVVLERTGKATPQRFPALMTAAFEALHIHPKANASTGTPLQEPVRKILGGAVQIVLGIDELRNTHGTGHGRAERRALSSRHAQLAVDAGLTVARLLLNTLDDPAAPWRTAQQQT